MSVNLFAYGTLIVPAVFQAVTGCHFDAADAELDGYARYAFDGKPYPGLIKETDGYVDGRVYRNLDEEALKRIRYFEDNIYSETTVTVTLDNNSKIEALAFVVPADRSALLSDKPWSLKKFKEEQLDTYLKNTKMYMRDCRS